MRVRFCVKSITAAKQSCIPECPSAHRQAGPQDAITSPPNFLSFATSFWISQFPLPTAAECTLMRSHITQRRKKNRCRTTSKQLISFVMVSRTLISGPLRPCFLLNKNQGRCLIVLFLKGSVQHYSKSLKVIHPGTPRKHRRCYRNEGQVLIAPKGCSSPVSFGLTPGSPFCPESGCVIPPRWLCAPWGSWHWGMLETYHSPANNCFSSSAANRKVRGGE